MIERRWSVSLLLIACLFPASRTFAQQPGIVARMLFPPRNYEIALGDTITPSVRVWNRDTISHGGDAIYYSIGNVVDGFRTYFDSIILPSIAPGDSLDTTFAPYPTSPNILRELGTFDACLIVNSDTVCARLFGMRRAPVPYRDPSDNYGKTASGDIPDQFFWASFGATVVDGEDSTWDPPPPRYAGGVGKDSFISPVIRLDRKDLSGNYYSGDGVGDTLTSFPINLQGKTKMTFHFDYMRAGRHRYPLGWDTAEVVGPESTITDGAGKVIRPGDSLILEFKKPSAPALNPGPSDWNEMAAIDGGHDFEFKSFFARPIDSGWQITIDGKTTFLHDTSNYFTADFRFRFRLKAKDDHPSGSPMDDADAWYIDNPTVELPLLPELEVRWVRVVNPYTKVPQSQAVFPVFVNVLNYGPDDWYGPPFRVKIFDPNGHAVYSQQVDLNQLAEGEDTVLGLPDWDASNLPGNASKYTVTAAIDLLGFDSKVEDDSTYTKFFLNSDDSPGATQEFAYDNAGIDPRPNTGNDIPKLTGIPGSGIGFAGMTGSLAMKFQLARMDTLYGASVYFGSANQAPDGIRISLLNGDSNSPVPLDTVVQSGVRSTMRADRGGAFFDQFWPYFYPRPIVLPAGTYWIAISQLSTNSMELGGYFSRGGGQFMNTDNSVPRIQSTYSPTSSRIQKYGTQWGSGPDDNNGDVSSSFAMETPAGSGNWKPMMPGSGWWPAMTASSSMVPTILTNLDTLTWTGAGTYLPMIRPMIGQSIEIPFGVSATPAVPVFGLQPNYPNPFDPKESSTTIDFVLPTQAPVSLTISNIMGDVIKTLINSPMAAGTHSVSWDGRNELGAIVPAGVYLVSLRSTNSHASAKLLITQ